MASLLSEHSLGQHSDGLAGIAPAARARTTASSANDERLHTVMGVDIYCRIFDGCSLEHMDYDIPTPVRQRGLGDQRCSRSAIFNRGYSCFYEITIVKYFSARFYAGAIFCICLLHYRPNNSFKPTLLRGAGFFGSVYHNAAPLRNAA